MYLPRTIEGFLSTASRQYPGILVTGPRQVGKTTVLQHVAEPGRTYVSLDDPLVLRLAREDPPLFLQRFPPPVLIDEIQYAPQLFPYLKILADERRTAGFFWLTGSQPSHLMKNVSESLAGRVAVISLQGFSLRELSGTGLSAPPFLPSTEWVPGPGTTVTPRRLMDIYRIIWRGAFPAVAGDDGRDRDLFYGSLLQTYLQRDLRDLANVGDEMAFLRFLRAAAARTAQLLNLSALARDADVAVNTAKKWLSILQASGMVHLLEPYHTNFTLRLVKAPKLHFLDTGLCAFLTGWSSPETLEAGAMAGAIFESWVFAEILKSYLHNGKRAPLFHFRNRDGEEIDLLIESDARLHPVEVKKTASPSAVAVRHFSMLDRLGVPRGDGALVCLASEPLPLRKDAWAIPAGMI